MKKCICIRDGFMQSGRPFCYKDKVYKYKRSPDSKNIFGVKYSDDYPYRVKSEALGDHTMRESFFFKYFMPFENILEDKLFEI